MRKNNQKLLQRTIRPQQTRTPSKTHEGKNITTFKQQLLLLQTTFPNLAYFHGSYSTNQKYKLAVECKKCNAFIPFSERKHNRLQLCAECRLKHKKEVMLKNNAKNKVKNNTRNKNRNQQIKYECYRHYSNGEPKCKNCGNTDIRVLTMDHVDGSGYEHRKIIKSRQITRVLKAKGFPEGYQVLCMNCQFIKKYENNELPWSKTRENIPDACKSFDTPRKKFVYELPIIVDSNMIQNGPLLFTRLNSQDKEFIIILYKKGMISNDWLQQQCNKKWKEVLKRCKAHGMVVPKRKGTAYWYDLTELGFSMYQKIQEQKVMEHESN